MPIPRLQLIELEDQAWFPRIVRDLATDYLQFLQTNFRLDRAMRPVLRKALDESGATHIVDLCSGGSGPLRVLVRDLQAEGCPVRATLTDLYPNVLAFEEIAAASGGSIAFVAESVDARAVPASLAGLRTIFNGFHHFRPGDARAVLHAAARDRQPIAIFELSERTIKALVSIVLTQPLFVWLATPFMRPFRWSRLLLTYPLPLVPFTCLWDGIVSQLRCYTTDELLEMGRGAPQMRWEAGQIPIVKGQGHLTYLIGIPC